jgi:hypothetical protein
MVLVEVFRVLGDRVNDDASDAQDGRRLSKTQNGVLKERGAELSPLMASVDGKSANKCHRDGIRHVALDPPRRVDDRQRPGSLA